MKKATRTISGITPVAVMTSPMKCPGECIFCPTYPSIPRSYTPESPAVLRSRNTDYDAESQIKIRLDVLSSMGHPTDKIELIVMGGTFLAYPLDYQYQFIKECYDALNGEVSVTLHEAKSLNEKAVHRCVGLSIETRPDWCGQEEINRMLDFGTTKVELGVQTLDDEIYRLTKRGHGVKDVARATALLKTYGFKVHYHWMPGLPGSTPVNDLRKAKLLFSDNRFKPDGLKLYPTMVVDGTELERWYHDGRYQPYDDDTMISLMLDIKYMVPKYVRISRVVRDIPSKFIVAGLRNSPRDELKRRMAQQNIACKCIRCREYGHRARVGWQIGEPKLMRMDYEASGGKEIFLSFEDKCETLFGLLRLRITQKPLSGLTQNCEGNSAIIRELHVYGPEVALTKQDYLAAQHKGLGKALLQEAEQIAREEFGVSQIAILSGVGAKDYYYTELDYSAETSYMIKCLV
jgi:elongator complex protein 3